MARYLTFQLYGMLAAYGLVAVGEVRLTAGHPTRSAVFGLLAACLGIRRDEEERLRALSDGYGLAVRVDAPGVPLLDYHTIQTPPEKSKRVYRTRADELGGLLGRDEEPYTILSRRGYLCDAHFTACLRALSDTPPFTLEEFATALHKPVFAPYLGRKCCPPSLPFAPRIGAYDSAAEALDAYPLDGTFLGKFFGRSGRQEAPSQAFTDTTEPFENIVQHALVRDRTHHHGRRQFLERQEAMATVAPGRSGDKEVGHVSQ